MTSLSAGHVHNTVEDGGSNRAGQAQDQAAKYHHGVAFVPETQSCVLDLSEYIIHTKYLQYVFFSIEIDQRIVFPFC